MGRGVREADLKREFRVAEEAVAATPAAIDPARSQRAREKVNASRTWPAWVRDGSRLLQIIGEQALEIIERYRAGGLDGGVPTGHETLVEDFGSSSETERELITKYAYEAFATGFFNYEDLYVPVNKLLAHHGLSCTIHRAQTALADTECAELVVLPHIREAVAKILEKRREKAQRAILGAKAQRAAKTARRAS